MKMILYSVDYVIYIVGLNQILGFPSSWLSTYMRMWYGQKNHCMNTCTSLEIHRQDKLRRTKEKRRLRRK